MGNGRTGKIGFCVLLALIIFGLLWYLVTRPGPGTRAPGLTSGAAQDFERSRAGRQPPVKRQLAQVNSSCGSAAPATEMPALINDISRPRCHRSTTSCSSRADAEGVLRRSDRAEDGRDHHQFDAVASLPRVVIMTMHDIAAAGGSGLSGPGPTRAWNRRHGQDLPVPDEEEAAAQRGPRGARGNADDVERACSRPACAGAFGLRAGRPHPGDAPNLEKWSPTSRRGPRRCHRCR